MGVRARQLCTCALSIIFVIGFVVEYFQCNHVFKLCSFLNAAPVSKWYLHQRLAEQTQVRGRHAVSEDTYSPSAASLPPVSSVPMAAHRRFVPSVQPATPLYITNVPHTAIPAIKSRCLNGSRLLAGIGSYGDSLATWKDVSWILSSLNVVRLSGVSVDVVLDLSVLPSDPSLLKVPEALNTEIRVFGKQDTTLNKEYLQYFKASLKNNVHDWYMYLENDIAITLDTLEALCEESQRIGDLEVRRDDHDWLGFLQEVIYPKGSSIPLMVGVFRFETEYDNETAPKYLTEVPLGNPPEPQLLGLLEIKGREYVVARNTFQAMFFLSRKQFGQLVRRQESRGGWQKRWEEKGGSGGMEYYSSWWVSNVFLKIIPLRRWRRYLVHHMSNIYVRNPERKFVVGCNALAEDFFGAAQRWNGQPLKLERPSIVDHPECWTRQSSSNMTWSQSLVEWHKR